jgi:dTDP-4-amino-4,6-dideoxygalactose transaminase
MKITFNKPFFTGKETKYIKEAVRSAKISGDGIFTKKCHNFFESSYGFKKVMLTTSCTDALEMCALLADIKPGDEVIIPSFTFVSTANAFVLRGAKIRFADSSSWSPNINADDIESLITRKTKAIVIVHYAGIACEMDKILKIARKHKLLVIEDAAQAIDSYFNGRPLGSIGNLAAFSFHETKNVISGEGGMLAVNDNRFRKRAEIIWEKGTNRSAFFRGEVNKYGWVDIGSSYLPSEITAAFLFAQLENIRKIQNKRISIWKQYYKNLQELEGKGFFSLPVIPPYATNNGHMFFIICRNLKERSNLINHLKKHDIMAVFHYQSLHKSPYYRSKHDGRALKNCEKFTDRLLRLPLYFKLALSDVDRISGHIKKFYGLNG